MRPFFGFGFRTAGNQGIQYRGREGRICSAAAPVLGGTPVWISGPGFDLVSPMDPDATIVPGMFRPILDAETGEEAFRLLCRSRMEWAYLGPGPDITLLLRDRWFGFRQNGRIIGTLRPFGGPLPPDVRGVRGTAVCLLADFLIPPDPKTLASLLAFPLLKFL